MQQEEEEKKMKVKKGWVTVQVGWEEEEEQERELERFNIPIWYLYHPLLEGLLQRAYDVYGYHTHGPLKLPCSVDDFLHLRWRIHKESLPLHHHFLHSC
ncbi:hypothetical protein HN51_012783 [Arachis hypogaea]